MCTNHMKMRAVDAKFFQTACHFDDIGLVEVYHVSQGVANFVYFLIHVIKVLIMQLCD